MPENKNINSEVSDPTSEAEKSAASCTTVISSLESTKKTQPSGHASKN